MSFCSLMKRITLKTCRSCFCVTINKHSFESFLCLDLVLECYQSFLFQIFISDFFCFHDSCIKPVVWWQHWPVSEVGETAVQCYPTWRQCPFQSQISSLPQRWCQWMVAFFRSGLQPVPINTEYQYQRGNHRQRGAYRSHSMQGVERSQQ